MTGRRNSYIHANVHFFRSWKAVLIALITVAAAAGIALWVFYPTLQRGSVGEAFLTTMYESTAQDAQDPSARLDKLRELTTEDFFETLLKNGAVPADYLHRAGIEGVTTTFERGTLPHDMAGEPDDATEILYGTVRIADERTNTRIGGYMGLFSLTMEEIDGRYLVADMTPVNWQERYEVK